MCTQALPKPAGPRTGCGCGGHGRPAMASDPRSILALRFDGPKGTCECGARSCPRHYLAPTGFLLGGFLLLHLALNSVALWPQRFQSAVHWNHSLGAFLPVLEIGLIFIPLTIHVAFGLRTLWREKLRFNVQKHHRGSPLRYWLQRVSAVVLLAFILFHVGVMHRWFGSRFDARDAFNSASQAIWQFWHGLPPGHPLNLLFAQFYLLGLAAAAYHVANGISTGAEVMGWVRTPAAQDRLWRLCLCGAPVVLLTGLVAWYALAPG